MMELAQAQAQFKADTRGYASTIDELGVPVPDNVGDKYTIEIEVEDGPPASYIISATPVQGGPQADDVALTIDSAGTRTPSDKW
jgi:type IV pilus assembly protein PilE